MNVYFEQVERPEDEQALIKAVELNTNIRAAIDLLENGAQKISVQNGSETYMCPVKDIYYIESVDKRTYIYTKSACYEVKLRLRDLETKLSGYFARSSKAMIINLRKIKSVSSEIGGRMNAVLLNDETVVIARSYVKEIKRRLEL